MNQKKIQMNDVWPFKRKQKQWKPKSKLDYFLFGIMHAQDLKKKYPMPKRPIYTPSKIILKK